MSTDAARKEFSGSEPERLPNEEHASPEAVPDAPFFPIGETVKLWKGARDPHRELSGWTADSTPYQDGREWRVAKYDATRKVYTLEFLGTDGGTYEATEEQLLKYNPERSERIKQKMNEPPSGVVH